MVVRLLKSAAFAVVALSLVMSPLTAQAAKAKKNNNGGGRRAAMLAKYDTNKDGKLDKAERAKMTPEDAAKVGKKKN